MKKTRAVDANEKLCKCCLVIKKVVYFYKQQQRSNTDKNIVWQYYDTICIECRKKYATNRIKMLKEQCVRYKGGECEHCGYNEKFYSVYDFHHTGDIKKEFAISKKANLCFEKLKPELDKCILLCAICHRKIHYENDI